MNDPQHGSAPRIELEQQALEGLRVLELTDWIAGPYAGCLLADFGATVIMVERRDELSGARQMGGLEEGDDERSPYFCVFARNKQSITIDFTEPSGAATLLELIDTCDVVICSFKPGVLDRHGIGWSVISERNPGLILLEISGYGQTGPLRESAGFDRVAQAFGGMTYVTGHPEMAPTRAGLTVVDYMSGLWGAFGILVAIEERRRSGRGQRIDHALYETLLPMHRDSPVQYLRKGEVKERSGNYSPGFAPGEVFSSSDGIWVHLSANGDRAFQRLMTAMDAQDALKEPKYATPRLRDQNHLELHQRIRDWMNARTMDDIESTLVPAGVALGRLQNIEDMMTNEHIIDRGNYENHEHPIFGPIPAVAPIPRLSRTPGKISTIGPRLGENTDAILQDLLSYDNEKIGRLRSQGVI